jgi:hypothetical protein
MTQLLMRYSSIPVEGPCGVCGESVAQSVGTHLVLTETLQPVCHACGQRHAPPLAALVQLADEAERVGRIGRHSVFPPYTALLDLARAADRYATSRAESRRDEG